MKLGLVGWRGMVGSVLLQRMQAERDFDLVDPVFFSTSQAGARGPALARNARVKDARNIDELALVDVIISCQGGDYTNEIYPKLRATGWDGYWIDAASALRMREDAVKILFAHRKTDHADASSISVEHRDREIIWVSADRLRIRAEPLAFGGAVGRVAHRRDVHVLPPTNQVDFGERFRLDTRRHGRIGEARQKRIGAAVPAPDREQVGKPRRVRDVRISVEGDLETRSRRGLRD